MIVEFFFILLNFKQCLSFHRKTFFFFFGSEIIISDVVAALITLIEEIYDLQLHHDFFFLIKMIITSVRAIIDHDPTGKKCCMSHDNQCQHVLDTRRKRKRSTDSLLKGYISKVKNL
jgi:hypothetical protein